MWRPLFIVDTIFHSCTESGCDQKFNTKSNLKKHLERKHENQQKQYVVSMTNAHAETF